MKKFLVLSGLFLTLALAPVHAMKKKSKSLSKQQLMHLNTQPLMIRLKAPNNSTTNACKVAQSLDYACLECRKHYPAPFNNLRNHTCLLQKDCRVMVVSIPLTPQARTFVYTLPIPKPMDEEIDQTTLLDTQENKPNEQPLLQSTFDCSQFFV